MTEVAASARVQSQSFGYDWRGNLASSTDDAGIFYDRSLGQATFLAALAGLSWGRTSSATAKSASGSLQAEYDAAGNLTGLEVTRYGSCDDPEGGGALRPRAPLLLGRGGAARSRTADEREHGRGDGGVAGPDGVGGAGGIRGRRRAVRVRARAARGCFCTSQTTVEEFGFPMPVSVYSAEIFPTLRLDGASWDGAKYQADESTESAYLVANGTSYGRVIYDATLPSYATGSAIAAQHVFLEMQDRLGSTSTVIDRATGELVERRAYMAYGRDRLRTTGRRAGMASASGTGSPGRRTIRT